MKTMRTIVMMMVLVVWANAHADITEVTTDGELEVETQTQGVDRQQIQTNVVDVTSFNHSLMTNSAFGGSTVTASAEQQTTVNVSGNTLTLTSTADTEITATLSGNPTNDFFTGGTGLAIFSVGFTISEQSFISASGLVSVTTPGDFGSTDSQVCFEAPTNVCFEAEDDLGDPRQVTISGSGVLEPGTYSIFMFLLSTLSETQTTSKGHWELTLSVTPGGPPPPPTNQVQVVALEVVQAVQNFNNSVPLISNKVTFVRAHFQSASEPTVTGKLRGFRDGVELPGSPLSSINSPAIAVTSTNAAAVRGDLIRNLNFQLPQSWRFGTIDLQLEPKNVAAGPLQFNCLAPLQMGSTSNSCKTQVTFTTTPPLLMRFVKINQVLPSGQAVNTPTDADVLEFASRIKAVFPIDTVHYTFTTLPGFPAGSSTNIHFLGSVNAALEWLRFSEGCGGDPLCTRIYFGVLRGFTTRFSGLAPALNGVLACAFASDPSDLGNRRQTAPHELGHVLGRAHAVDLQGFGVGPCPFLPGSSGVLGDCGECATGPNPPDFPDFSNINGKIVPTLGPLDVMPENIIFGLNTYYPKEAVDPNEHFELMGYCGPKYKWASLFTYTNLISTITSRFSSPPAAAATVLAAVGDLLVVRGSVDVQTDLVTFFPFGQISGPVPPPAPPSGEYTLQLLDAGSNVVAEVSFQPDLDSENESSLGTFLIAVPADPTIKQAVLRHNGVVIGTRTASANPPTVQVVFPNGGETIIDDPAVLQWTGSDADGDPLTYVVQYSADGGVTFETLAVDWPDQTIPVEHELLTGSSTAVIRVIASDGFNSATDVSDNAFTVANNRPQVFILTPTPGQMFFGDQHLFLEAFALDREDGELSGASLQWSSDIDGPLGVGAEIDFEASQLTAGSHLISVIATDGGSLSSTASVTIVVAQVAPAALADLIVTKEAATDTVAAGTSLSYTITVENQGPSPATGVMLTDTLPANAGLISVTSSQGNCTPSGNSILCDLGNVPSGSNAIAIVVVRPIVEGTITNTVTVAGNDPDPIPANNTAQAVSFVGPPPPVPHDLAVLSVKPPKKIALSEKKPSQTKGVKISIQNLSEHTETIDSLGKLTNVVGLTIESLGACPVPTMAVVPPKTGFPVALAPKKKLSVVVNVTFDCSNDDLQGLDHEDFRYTVSINHAALDGQTDTEPENNDCPRGPSGSDKGCGAKNPVTKQLGADVLTDVVIK